MERFSSTRCLSAFGHVSLAHHHWMIRGHIRLILSEALVDEERDDNVYINIHTGRRIEYKDVEVPS